MGKTFSTGLLTNGIWQDSSNNIGIGAANSSYKFQVTGTTNLTGALSGTSAVFSSSARVNGASDNARLSVLGTSGNPSMTADTNNLFSITGSLGPQLNIGGYNGASYGMWFQVKDSGNTNVNYPILLQPLGGAVGIGTVSPQTFLHIVGANNTGRGQLSIQSNNTSNAARISFYYDTNLQGNVGTTSADFYVESVNTLVLLPGNGNTTRGGTIREFAGTVSPPSPYTADLRLTVTHNGWGGNADSGTVYVEYQGRAYGNNQTTTAFGVITYRLSDNGVSVTNVSTAGVTVSSVTISTDVSSNYILRITFGVAQNVDRASIFARTTNTFVSSISVDTV